MNRNLYLEDFVELPVYLFKDGEPELDQVYYVSKSDFIKAIIESGVLDNV